jgi:hypothetical protein
MVDHKFVSPCTHHESLYCPIARIVLDALTIWTIARSHEVSELIDGLDISEHGIIEPLKMLDDVS